MQRYTGIGKNSPSSYRKLVITIRAFVNRAGFVLINALSIFTVRANWAVLPELVYKVLSTILVSREVAKVTSHIGYYHFAGCLIQYTKLPRDRQ
jgi:hypothetical protein